jgi:ankyrin repeat protein
MATSKGNTSLHAATMTGCYSMVKLVLRHNPDLKAKNAIGFTPLMQAKKWNLTSIATLLARAEAPARKIMVTPSSGRLGGE